jgi:hypothetical protein
VCKSDRDQPLGLSKPFHDFKIELMFCVQDNVLVILLLQQCVCVCVCVCVVVAGGTTLRGSSGTQQEASTQGV